MLSGVSRSIGLTAKLLVSQSQLSGKVDMMALLGGETFRTLQTVTQTNAQAPATVIEAATSQIQTLQAEVAELRTTQTDLNRMFWRRFTDRERALLKGLFEGLDRHAVRVVHTGQADCAELAHDLKQVFRSAGWDVDDQGLETGTWETAGMSGIHILGKDLVS
jgi:hypothetical protein